MSSHWRWNISLSSVQSLSHVRLCDPKDCSTPGLPVCHQLPEFTQTYVHWSSNHLILCRPLLLLPSIFPSIRVFSDESALRIRWPKYWNFSFSISPSSEYSGLTSFRMDWLGLLAVRAVVFNSLQPHGLQHTRPPSPSPTPGVYSNSCPFSQWCHPTISSSVVPFSSCLLPFPVSGSFQITQFFASGGQSIGVSASASVLPVNIQDWLPLGWSGWISLLFKGLSRVFSNTTVQKHQFFGAQLSL